MSTFLGQEMQQEWADLPIWERFFNDNPIKTFVELGTGLGGMSIFFALQCYQRHIYFHTFDNQKFYQFDHGVPVLLDLLSTVHFMDIFKDDGLVNVIELIRDSPHPIALFCDDGDKPKEFRTFAPLLDPGDFVIVHDWGTEIFQKDLEDVPVLRIMTSECDARPAGWKAMWFRRVIKVPA